MIDSGARNFISLSVILLACVFGFVALVSARVQSSVESRHTAIAALADARRTAPAADQILSFQSQTAVFQAWIQQNNAAEGSRLYSQLLALGDREGLRIERIDPASRDEEQGLFATTVAFSIEAVGSYQNVARFIGAIENDFGFASVVGFSLTPIDGEQGELVHASLETAHRRFDPKAAPVANAEVEEGE